jgi:hypothetical protein
MSVQFPLIEWISATYPPGHCTAAASLCGLLGAGPVSRPADLSFAIAFLRFIALALGRKDRQLCVRNQEISRLSKVRSYRRVHWAELNKARP